MTHSLHANMFQHTAARRRLAAALISCIKAVRCFNIQPPEGGWDLYLSVVYRPFVFQHTAARRRLVSDNPTRYGIVKFQHTAARRRLDRLFLFYAVCFSFNTQPPEGGWASAIAIGLGVGGFNTQPPEGGWADGHEVIHSK